MNKLLLSTILLFAVAFVIVVGSEAKFLQDIHKNLHAKRLRSEFYSNKQNEHLASI
jgi:hypothetical protein